MKLVKLTMSAAAAMVFIGASSVSATPTWIGLCKTATLLNCAKANLVKHPLLGRLIPLVGPGKFNAGFVTIECEGGTGNSNQIEAQQNKEFTGTIESLTFASCKGCTAVAVVTPQAVLLKMNSEAGEWRLQANNAKVKFTGCPLGQFCTYEAVLDLEVQMNATDALVEPKGFEFKRVTAESTALCSEKGKWETGTTLFDWELDDAGFPNGTRHKGVTPSLIGAILIKTF
jgi:hypothetical protein